MGVFNLQCWILDPPTGSSILDPWIIEAMDMKIQLSISAFILGVNLSAPIFLSHGIDLSLLRWCQHWYYSLN